MPSSQNVAASLLTSPPLSDQSWTLASAPVLRDAGRESISPSLQPILGLLEFQASLARQRHPLSHEAFLPTLPRSPTGVWDKSQVTGRQELDETTDHGWGAACSYRKGPGGFAEGWKEGGGGLQGAKGLCSSSVRMSLRT